MRSISIKTVFAISVVAVLSPQLALATTPSFSCSSNLVVSLDNGYQASCDGDFSFTDGVLQNEVSINLSASGFLNIGTNTSLIAPAINLYSPNININAGAVIDASNPLNAGLGSISISAGKGRLAILDEPEKLPIVLNPGASIGFGNSQLDGVLNNIGGVLVIKSPTVHITNSVLNPDSAIFTTVSPVPEPSTYAMVILGLATIGLSRKSKKD